MIKEIKVTFQFDPETELVSNLICSVDGVEKKKKATSRKKKEEPIEMASEALITLEETKLVFNNKAVADMELEPEDRIILVYEQEKKSKKLIPVIGTDIAFDKEGSGNRLTKSFTVGYKGKQNAVLAEFGTEFALEPYGDGLWKMVSTDPNAKTIEAKAKPEKVKPEKASEKPKTEKIIPILEADEGDDEIPIDVNLFEL